MCGLVGVAGNLGKKDEDFFRQALYADTLRGSHNTGAAFVRANDVVLAKCEGPAIHLLNQGDFNRACTPFAKVMLGHNRHATVGDKTEANAHPFEFDRIVGAHNGTLDFEARRALEDYEKFGTDSEALYHNINLHGIDAVIPEMRGAWALTFWDKKAGNLTLLRNRERPLSYAFNKAGDTIYWASEHEMLRWLLVRNQIDFETILIPNVDTLIEFHVPGNWNKKIQEVRVVELKGKPFQRAHQFTPTFTPTGNVGEFEPWDMGQVLEGWSPSKGSATKKPNDNVKRLNAPAANDASSSDSSPKNELKGVQPSTRKKLLDKAWDEGFIAGEDPRKVMAHCPYKKGGILYSEWKAGFDTARYDRQSKSAVKDTEVKCRDHKGFPMTEAEFIAATDGVCAWGECPVEYTDEFKWFDANTCVCSKCINQENEVKELFSRYV